MAAARSRCRASRSVSSLALSAPTWRAADSSLRRRPCALPARPGLRGPPRSTGSIPARTETQRPAGDWSARSAPRPDSRAGAAAPASSAACRCCWAGVNRDCEIWLALSLRRRAGPPRRRLVGWLPIVLSLLFLLWGWVELRTAATLGLDLLRELFAPAWPAPEGHSPGEPVVFWSGRRGAGGSSETA